MTRVVWQKYLNVMAWMSSAIFVATTHMSGPILGGWLPEARASLRDTATFVRRVLDVAGDLTAGTLPPDAG